VYERAPREAWTSTGDSVSRAAFMIAWICSMFVDVEGADAVAAVGGGVEELT
jgi:hypothetical protein